MALPLSVTGSSVNRSSSVPRLGGGAGASGLSRAGSAGPSSVNSKAPELVGDRSVDGSKSGEQQVNGVSPFLSLFTPEGGERKTSQPAISERSPPFSAALDLLETSSEERRCYSSTPMSSCLAGAVPSREEGARSEGSIRRKGGELVHPASPSLLLLRPPLI